MNKYKRIFNSIDKKYNYIFSKNNIKLIFGCDYFASNINEKQIMCSDNESFNINYLRKYFKDEINIEKIDLNIFAFLHEMGHIYEDLKYGNNSNTVMQNDLFWDLLEVSINFEIGEYEEFIRYRELPRERFADDFAIKNYYKIYKL